MLQAKDLRIGNYILSNREYFNGPTIGVVYTIAESVVWFNYDHNGEPRGISNPYRCVEGIPLSEDWLLRAGFVHRNEHRGEGAIMDLPNENWKKRLSIALDYKKNGNSWAILTIGSRKFDYVHELQNVYYVLTGEELTIKESQK